MSVFRKTGRRCDWCGKFSMHPTGEYEKPNGSLGYINQPQWETNHVNSDGVHAPIDSESDICEECEANQCPNCGSADIVHMTPMTAGPYGWGGRCTACNKTWDMVVPT